MNIEKAARWLITFALWLLIAIIIALAAGGLALAGYTLPELGYLLPLSIGVIATALIWNEHGWEVIKRQKLFDIQRQIDSQLREMSDQDLAKVLDAMSQLKEHFDIDLQLPPAREKRKREQIDAAIRSLSDSELLYLKERLREGSVDDEQLIKWLRDEESSTQDSH